MTRSVLLFLLTLTVSFHPATAQTQRERFLLPIMVPPAQGAFGSEFVTTLTLGTLSHSSETVVHGITRPCFTLCPPTSQFITMLPPTSRVEVSDWFLMSGSPGRFIEVESAARHHLVGSLNVRDISRRLENAGTELPIVHYSAFRTRVVLPMPAQLGNEHRTMLRIYSAAEADVTVHLHHYFLGTPGGNSRDTVTLRTRRSSDDPFAPAYAQLDATRGMYLSRIDAFSGDGADTEPIWAFVSATNNATQLITIVTPQF